MVVHSIVFIDKEDRKHGKFVLNHIKERETGENKESLTPNSVGLVSIVGIHQRQISQRRKAEK